MSYLTQLVLNTPRFAAPAAKTATAASQPAFTVEFGAPKPIPAASATTTKTASSRRPR